MQLQRHLSVLKKKESVKINEWVEEERPTKLEIPNSNLGGDMDGMGDLDNAPMPPMGADDMGGEGQMADPMGGAPNDMGNEPPMEGPDDMGGDPNATEGPDMGNGEDDELMDIINNLSIEDKAAVTKYAKSMADNSEGGAPDMGGEMPMESRVNYRHIIDEVIEDMFDNKDGITRPQKKLPKEYNRFSSPFMKPNIKKDSI